MSQERLLITLCTYNELENLELLIPEIFNYLADVHVLVIDDDSPDGTGTYAQSLSDQDPRVHVLIRKGLRGLGTATIAGLRYGVDHGYHKIVNMDADFSHHPRYLPALIEAAEHADISIGSRYVSGGGVVGWGLLRHTMSRGINLAARCLLGLKTRDNSGSYRCYSTEQLQRIDWERIRSKGYAIQEELLYRCRAIGCTFREVPILFEDRKLGASKINWRESVIAVWNLMCLFCDRLFRVPVAVN